MRSGRPERPTKADSQTWLVFTPFFPFTLPSLMLSVSLSLISLILHPRLGSCLCVRTAAAVQGIGLVCAAGGWASRWRDAVDNDVCGTQGRPWQRVG